MQNRYVGDIGDYGKYGLLRALIPESYRLGVVWYLVQDENHLSDGRYIDYLAKLKFIDCDKELFSALKKIVVSGNRTISNIEKANILPSRTVYYNRYLSYDGINANCSAGRDKRLFRRKHWLDGALEAVKYCDAIFLDPDNGLETPSVNKHLCKAIKYVYYDEVQKFLSATGTLIIYHHLGRQGDHKTQIIERTNMLKQLTGHSYKIISLRFRPYSARAYFVLTSQEEIADRVKQFVKSRWRKCFGIVDHK